MMKITLDKAPVKGAFSLLKTLFRGGGNSKP